MRVRWGLILAIAASVIYAVTLQTDINGSNDKAAEDVGEFQNVLAQWGTAHPTGYPLYAFSGAAFASLLRAFGVSAAAAASAYSAAVSVLMLVGVYRLLRLWSVAPPVAAGTAMILGVLAPFWFHASVAEVYALLVGLIVLAFLFAAQWSADRDPRHLYPFALVVGLAVGHHRLALLALPALAIMASRPRLSTFHVRPSRLIAACAIALASLLIYLYLPIRAWTGGAWVYGQPGTWDGFWAIVTAREYGRLVQPEAGFASAFDALANNVTRPLLVAGAAGLLVALRDAARRKASLGLISLVVLNIAFVGVFARAVFLPAALMPAMLGLTLGAGLLLGAIAERGRAARIMVGAALVLGIAVLMAVNGPTLRAITQDPAGRRLIQNVAEARLNAAERPVVFALWGRDFFALAYARNVTGELPPVDLVDHRANVKALVDSGRPFYALNSAFYLRPLEWWDGRLGRAYLSADAGGLVRVSDRPVLSSIDLPPSQEPVAMGPSILLRAWRVESIQAGRSWRLTLYWQAVAPIERDYSVFVHATDRGTIDGPDAIIAQADSFAPVYGWYPTTRWSAGEIVRDDYMIQSPSDRQARNVSVGMYFQDAAGVFQNVGEHPIALP